MDKQTDTELESPFPELLSRVKNMPSIFRVTFMSEMKTSGMNAATEHFLMSAHVSTQSEL